MLNPKAFDLLTILAENPGQVLTKEEIIERLWPDSAVEEGNLAVQISHLRAALRFFSVRPDHPNCTRCGVLLCDGNFRNRGRCD